MAARLRKEETKMKKMIPFPVIDVEATGQNIERLRKKRGLTVQELQEFFGFETPSAIYQWQRGECLPSVDNLYALSAILRVTMNEILIPKRNNTFTKVVIPRNLLSVFSFRQLLPLPQLLAV